jgi:hypothetical protein
MAICLFLIFHHPARPATRLGPAEMAELGRIIKASPGLARALAFTPERTHDPYLDDGPPPILATQLYFADIAALEAALSASGNLQRLADPGLFPGLAGADIVQQAMLTRIFPVPMARFPGIREIEIYTRIDWVSALPWRRADCMQRNKVVFDDAAALTAALNSPVRHEMRADYHKLPPFEGSVSHYPMATLTL